MAQEQSSNYVKKPRKTTEEILKELEVTGIDFTPLGLGPWSYSKLKVLKNCPMKFYLQYILKVKPAGVPEISLVTEVGKAAHKILELMITGKDVKTAYSLTKKEFEKTITPKEWEENLDSVEYNITQFMEKLQGFEKSQGVKRYLQELRIGCTREWEPTGFFADDVFFRGVIDLVVQLKNGDIVIIDHKYGAPMIMGLKNFQDQLDTYKILFSKGIEAITGAQSGIHYVKEGGILLDDYASAEVITDSLVGRLEFFIEGTIESVLEIGYFKHITGNACKYCDYKAECKAGKFKQMEKDSKKWFEIKKV